MPAWSVLATLLLLAGTGASGRASTPPQDPEAWLREAQMVLAGVESYRATFHKQERVAGRLLDEETIALKFRRPRMIHMRWVKKPFAGREVVYVEGRNGNHMRVREAGILGLLPVDLDPRGSLAMKGNRHVIVEAGIESLVERLTDNLRRGRLAGELEVRSGGLESVYGRETVRLEGSFPASAAGRYYCRRAVLSFDIEKKVPIRAEIYDWDDALMEVYGFEDLRLDAGLTEADFALGRQ
jgi:hypothetical protein